MLGYGLGGDGCVDADFDGEEVRGGAGYAEGLE